MKVIYTPQFSKNQIEYDNDLENNIIRFTVNGEEETTHDLSDYVEPEFNEDGDTDVKPPGFPIEGHPRYIDGELHVTLIKWYR